MISLYFWKSDRIVLPEGRSQYLQSIELVHGVCKGHSLPRHFHEELELGIQQGDGWQFNYRGVMHSVPADTFGKYSCIEELVPQGPAAGPHSHEAADETFYILEGEATFFVEDQPIKATAGSFVSIPKGTKHAFQVDSETVRLLNTYVPAGFEYAIMATTVPAEARTLPPASPPFPSQEQANQSLEQAIQKYPAAKTNFLQGYES